MQFSVRIPFVELLGFELQTFEGGQATITIPAKTLLPGVSSLTAEYAGDASFAAATDTFTVSVSKAVSTVKFKVTPKTIKRNVTKAKVKITVSAVGVVPSGKVKVKVKGMKAVTTTLGNRGKAVVKLKTFGSVGKKNIKVTYLGNSLVLKSSAKSKITVTVKVAVDVLASLSVAVTVTVCVPGANVWLAAEDEL